LAGRRPALAVQAFLEQLQLAVSSVTHMPLRATAYEPGLPGAVIFPPPRGLPLPGHGDWYLTLAINYAITRGEGERGAWAVRTTSYYYELLQPAERRIVAYHWHPQPPNRVKLPHLHVPQHTAPVDLSRVHLPTPRVALEAILRLAIDELGVEPIRDDWRAVLEQTERAFRRWRTWTDEPPALT
jgi:hypothetical protein